MAQGIMIMIGSPGIHQIDRQNASGTLGMLVNGRPNLILDSLIADGSTKHMVVVVSSA
jgi:hypothetical protein